MKNFILFTLISTYSFAINADEFKVYVQSFDDDIDTSKLESKQISVNKQAQPVLSQTYDLPTPREMNAMFKQVDFGPEVINMDQMDRDLFYFKVAKRDMSYLRSKYPDVDPEKMQQLKKLIGKAQ